MSEPEFSPIGDSAISVTFGKVISPAINSQIRQVLHKIVNKNLPGLIEFVPTYCSLLIQYDPLQYSYQDMCELVKQELLDVGGSSSNNAVKVIELPTVYGGEYGPDLEFVASHANLTTTEVISIHSGTDYLVYMLGFIPGFAYLGGMDERLTTPRLSTPRTKIPAGSVGIAGQQTGTYPTESPGGWQIIGRTPLNLYDEHLEQPAVLSAGDYVRYVPIEESEYTYIKSHYKDYELVVHVCKEDELHG